ncbi:MAG: hypothetical protein GY791_04845 [Alphaproteobacteria bacterium]|nr:hypothetical protein [Alphaproteobacteria bacterium]
MTPSGIGFGPIGAIALAWRLIPAAVLFSLFFVFPGSLMWLGLLGFIPLALALTGRGCGCGRRPIGMWPSF